MLITYKKPFALADGFWIYIFTIIAIKIHIIFTQKPPVSNLNI